MRTVSIIIPIVRDRQVLKCVDAIRKNCDPCAYELVTAFDAERIGCPKMVAKLTDRTKTDLVMFLGDDTIPQPGFLDAAVAAMNDLPGGWGVVGLNTEDPNGANDRAHWLAHKKMLKHIPGGNFFATEYRHCYGDEELKDIAQELGRWVFAKKARIVHDHPINGRGEWDAEYQRAYDNGAALDDRITYQRRKYERRKAAGARLFGIAWPITNQVVFTDFALSYAAMRKPEPHLFLYPKIVNQMDAGAAVGGGGHRPGLDVLRNDLVDQALMAGCTDLIMMDTDQCYRDPDVLARLIGFGKPIVAGRVHRRYPPYDPICFFKNEPGFDDIVNIIKAGKFVEIEKCGCGCVLYDCSVFHKINRPWFEFTYRPGGQLVGEDISFHEKCREANIPIYMDMGADITHLGIHGTGADEFLLHEMLRRRQNGEREQAGL